MNVTFERGAHKIQLSHCVAKTTRDNLRFQGGSIGFTVMTSLNCLFTAKTTGTCGIPVRPEQRLYLKLWHSSEANAKSWKATTVVTGIPPNHIPWRAQAQVKRFDLFPVVAFSEVTLQRQRPTGQTGWRCCKRHVRRGWILTEGPRCDRLSWGPAVPETRHQMDDLPVLRWPEGRL